MPDWAGEQFALRLRSIVAIPIKGSLGNKFTDSKEMISMSCWFVTNALVLYPIEIKLEKMIVFQISFVTIPYKQNIRWGIVTNGDDKRERQSSPEVPA